MHCLGACRVSGLEELARFVSLVMMFSIVIIRDQLSPGTDKSPERRAENMGRPLKASLYGQYRSVQLVSPVGNGRIIGKNSCATGHKGRIVDFLCKREPSIHPAGLETGIQATSNWAWRCAAAWL
jgi:hypothetical protein